MFIIKNLTYLALGLLLASCSHETFRSSNIRNIASYNRGTGNPQIPKHLFCKDDCRKENDEGNFNLEDLINLKSAYMESIAIRQNQLNDVIELAKKANEGLDNAISLCSGKDICQDRLNKLKDEYNKIIDSNDKYSHQAYIQNDLFIESLDRLIEIYKEPAHNIDEEKGRASKTRYLRIKLTNYSKVHRDLSKAFAELSGFIRVKYILFDNYFTRDLTEIPRTYMGDKHKHYFTFTETDVRITLNIFPKKCKHSFLPTFSLYSLNPNTENDFSKNNVQDFFSIAEDELQVSCKQVNASTDLKTTYDFNNKKIIITYVEERSRPYLNTSLEIRRDFISEEYSPFMYDGIYKIEGLLPEGFFLYEP